MAEQLHHAHPLAGVIYTPQATKRARRTASKIQERSPAATCRSHDAAAAQGAAALLRGAAQAGAWLP